MPLNQKTAFRILLAALILQAMSIGYYAYYIHFHGYLPSPFVMEKSDTFMDLYNTIWWGAHDGRYTEWRSIYPPLNFIIVGLMRALLLPSGVGSDPAFLRAASLWPAYALTALHVIAPAFIVTRSTWNGFSNTNRAMIALAAVISPIFLFSIERGNLIVLPIFFLPFIFAERDGWWKPLLLAVIINLKPYFALLVFGYALVGDWRRFLQSLAFAGAIFLLSGLLEDPNFPLFLKNIAGFANGAALQLRALLSLPASPSSLTRAILMYVDRAGSSVPYPVVWMVLPPMIEAMKTGTIILALFGIFRCRRYVKPAEAFVLFLFVAVTVGIWAGGYSQIFYLATVPLFMAMRFRNAYLLLLVAIFLPWDMVTLHSEPPDIGFSFITGRTVWVSWQLGLGTVVRPLLNMVLIATFGAELLTRKNAPPRFVAARTRPSDLIPDRRFVLPAGVVGLVIGATFYCLAISSQTAVAVVRMQTGLLKKDPGHFLRESLLRRTTPQFVIGQLQTRKVTDRIAQEIGEPDLAQRLADRQYGGDAALTARLTDDARFIQIKILLPNPAIALRAADIAASIAMEIDEAAQPSSLVPASNPVSADWQNIEIGAAINPVISDTLLDLANPSLPSIDRMIRQTGINDSPSTKAVIYLPATLSTKIIDSWWLGALVGGVACGSLGYALSLSQSRRKYTA